MSLVKHVDQFVLGHMQLESCKMDISIMRYAQSTKIVCTNIHTLMKNAHIFLYTCKNNETKSYLLKIARK